MTTESRPSPEVVDPDAPARADAGIFGLDVSPEDAAVMVVPVPWDATTSYRAGAAGGPAAILKASHQLDLFDVRMGHPYRAGISMVDAPVEIEAWNREARRRAEPIIAAAGEIEGAPGLEADLAEVNRLGAAVDARVRAEVDRWLDAGKIVGVVGGDHSVALGAIEAHASRHPALSVLHVDAHADLRVAYEGFERSHASIMHNVLERTAVERLVQVGVRDLGVAEHATITESDRIRTHFDAHLAERRLAGDTWAAQCEAIVRDLTETVYVSFDIDGLDPKLCPHTGTPVPGGLSFAQARFLLAAVAESGRRIVGFDLSEVAPGPDGDEWDGNVGARILYQLVGWTLRSREPS